MSETKWIVVAIIAAVCAQVGFFYMTKDSMKGRTVTYDCSLSEISPDFTTEMREMCRQIRGIKL